MWVSDNEWHARNLSYIAEMQATAHTPQSEQVRVEYLGPPGCALMPMALQKVSTIRLLRRPEAHHDHLLLIVSTWRKSELWDHSLHVQSQPKLAVGMSK